MFQDHHGVVAAVREELKRMAKNHGIAIDRLKDGRWCAVIFRVEGGRRVILSVCADADPEKLKADVRSEIENAKWETRQ